MKINYIDIENQIEFKKDMRLGDGYNPVILNSSFENPEYTSIQSVFPNPFNPSTEINYILEKTSDVKISIYNINGRLIVNLVNAMQLEGSHTIQWIPDNLSSGIYLLKMVADNYVVTKKLVLLK